MTIRLLIFLLLSGCITNAHKEFNDLSSQKLNNIFSKYTVEIIAPGKGCKTDLFQNLPVKI